MKFIQLVKWKSYIIGIQATGRKQLRGDLAAEGYPQGKRDRRRFWMCVWGGARGLVWVNRMGLWTQFDG